MLAWSSFMLAPVSPCGLALGGCHGGGIKLSSVILPFPSCSFHLQQGDVLSAQPLSMYCMYGMYCMPRILPFVGNWETMRFLLSNARWWLDEYKFDGYRFDGEGEGLCGTSSMGTALTGRVGGSWGMDAGDCSSTPGRVICILLS